MSGTSPNAQTLRVLIVEHDEADVELCIVQLEKGGFDVRADVVGTAAEFSGMISKNAYDIVLADYRLPSWTGMDALRMLRELQVDTPFILVTGTLGDERAVECIKQGAADYIIKHNLGRLPVAVRRAMHDRSLSAERARNEDLIRKLRLAVDQSPASVLITDLSGTIEYVNDRFTRVTGYSAAEAIGNNPRLLKSGRTPPNVYHDLWSTIRAGNVYRGEVLNRRKNGDLFWDAVTIAPIRDFGGRVTHFVATQEDITARKHAEQTLRDREERFRQLADNISEVFFVMDAQLRETLYINQAYEEIWGRSCQSLYERPSSFLDAVLPEDRDALIAAIVRIQSGERTPDTEFRIVRPDGYIRWVMTRAVPVVDEHGNVYRISGIALDITERSKAQEALIESEARYRALTEASFEGIAIVENGVIRDANSGYAAMLGYEMIEVLGREVTDFVAEKSLDEVQRRLMNHIDGTYEITGRRKDGREITLEATAKTIEVGGKRERLTAVRDITEKRQLENQFRQAQKMEAVGRLAGGVAHDFNNLLTVIISYAELLMRGPLPDESSRDDLEQIRKAADGAAVLTRQLLAFSRQQVIQPRPVPLESIITGAEKLLKRLVGEDVDLECVLRSEPSVVLIDPSQLEQVLMNLAANARDAMPSGGKLTIETHVVDLDEEYARTHHPAVPGRFAVLSVSDTGAGMSSETQARIFEPFFTTKEIGRGTGLGLATVYGIVKQSGGFIWVYSEIDRGSAFKIYLPVVDQLPSAVERPISRDVPSGSETVLVVEDSPSVRAVAVNILKRHGYNMLEATSSRHAIDISDSYKKSIDLLLTDVVMPELNGRVLAEELLRKRPAMGVLFMSGYADDAVMRHGVLPAGTLHLQKPFTPGALALKVREVLDARPPKSDAASVRRRPAPRAKKKRKKE